MIRVDYSQTIPRILLNDKHVKTVSKEFADMIYSIGDFDIDPSRKRLSREERADIISKSMLSDLKNSTSIFDRALYDNIKNRKFLGFVVIERRGDSSSLCADFGGLKIEVPWRYLKFVNHISIKML